MDVETLRGGQKGTRVSQPAQLLGTCCLAVDQSIQPERRSIHALLLSSEAVHR